MARRLASCCLVLALAMGLAACGDDDATGTDAGPSGGDAGSLPPATAATLGTAGFGLGIAAALTGPLVPQAESLRDGGGRLDGAARETRTRTDVEAGVSGMSVVMPSTCVAYAWAGLSVTATFTGCTLETTGESVSGSVGIAVTYFPTTFTVTFTSLTVGTTSVDGMLALNVGGECGGADLGCMGCPDTDPMCAAMRMNQQTLTGALTIRSGSTTVLGITGLAVSNDATGVTVSGMFTVDGLAATATDLHWNMGDCLPVRGTVALPSMSTTITFLPTTPSDGIVQVQLGAFPPFPQMLFAACT